MGFSWVDNKYCLLYSLFLTLSKKFSLVEKLSLPSQERERVQREKEEKEKRAKEEADKLRAEREKREREEAERIRKIREEEVCLCTVECGVS